MDMVQMIRMLQNIISAPFAGEKAGIGSTMPAPASSCVVESMVVASTCSMSMAGAAAERGATPRVGRTGAATNADAEPRSARTSRDLMTPVRSGASGRMWDRRWKKKPAAGGAGAPGVPGGHSGSQNVATGF